MESDAGIQQRIKKEFNEYQNILNFNLLEQARREEILFRLSDIYYQKKIPDSLKIKAERIAGFFPESMKI